MFVPGQNPGDPPTEAPCRPRCALTRLAAASLITDPSEQHRLEQTQRQFPDAGIADFHFAADARRCPPDAVMPTLRFGGQFAFVTRNPREAQAVHDRYNARPEFLIERPPHPLPGGRLAKALHRTPLLLVARKVLLDAPHRLVTRQSFDVRLTRSAKPGRDEWVVTKRVPGLGQTISRLSQLMPHRDDEHIQRLARKMVTSIFPTLLTRETGFLRLLHERLPAPEHARVPKALRAERDPRGIVHRLDMTWLREGGDPITPISFARQAAQLLDAIHTHARIIHLDLRLDNMVVTPQGVGFVDFGSACLINEPLEGKQMIGSLFNSMLSASRIRRDLRRLRRKRLVTSSLFDHCYPRRDPAIDLFALALQMTRPWANPGFRGLVHESDTDRPLDKLHRLQRQTLRPDDPRSPVITRPAQIAAALAGRPTEPVAPASPTPPQPQLVG